MTGSRDDVARLLPAFDVFSLSSLHEGLSIALVEAIGQRRACGVHARRRCRRGAAGRRGRPARAGVRSWRPRRGAAGGWPRTRRCARASPRPRRGVAPVRHRRRRCAASRTSTTRCWAAHDRLRGPRAAAMGRDGGPLPADCVPRGRPDRQADSRLPAVEAPARTPSAVTRPRRRRPGRHAGGRAAAHALGAARRRPARARGACGRHRDAP